MALYSKSEIAELCGIKKDSARSYIKNNVDRGKLILSGDYIDDSISINAEFIQKRLENKASKDGTVKIEEPNVKPAEVPAVKNKLKVAEPKEEAVQAVGLDQKIKKVELLKKEAETRLLNLKEEKIRGEVVPIGLIKPLFSSHTQSILTAHKDGIEDLLINFSKEARLTGDQLAKLRGKMVDILNAAVDKAIAITQSNMKVMVEEFSIKKEVGEHE